MLTEFLKLTHYHKTKIDLVLYSNEEDLFTPSHIHKEFEVLMVKKYPLFINIQGEEFILNEEDIVIINPQVVHSTLAKLNHQQYLIQFTFPTILDEKDVKKIYALNYKMPYMILKKGDDNYDELAFYVKNIYKANTNTPWSTNYVKGYFYQLYAFFQKIGFMEPQTVDTSKKGYDKIQKITEYIQENYTSDITLESLSHMFYINPSYLCRLFKEVMNSTIVEYLNQIRVKNAELFLTSTDKSIMEIAQLLGFSSQTYFNRVFKSIMMLTPSEYRKLQFDRDRKWLRIETKKTGAK
ncbi:MAG: helix-turn-helix transcriptional regulator [Ruminococcaceae bacterium]|nr:helix-turn-helix transcriptional regulator [Oscillospiraceae bacterium]